MYFTAKREVPVCTALVGIVYRWSLVGKAQIICSKFTVSFMDAQVMLPVSILFQRNKHKVYLDNVDANIPVF